jgi:hypothetical protein
MRAALLTALALLVAGLAWWAAGGLLAAAGLEMFEPVLRVAAVCVALGLLEKRLAQS